MSPSGEAVRGRITTQLLSFAMAIGSALWAGSGLTAATLPAGFTETEMASFTGSPTCMQFSPDGKLFIAQQNGVMPVWQNGSQLSANFFANQPLVTDTASERGLLGIAFDPNFASNRFVYVYYTTVGGDHHNQVVRFTADSSGNLAVVGSGTTIWTGDAHSAGNHNGGAIHFGPDGKLYIATGDNANGSNAQSLASQHGKILRINPDGSTPSDNPFQAGGQQARIWSYGLRNPFTFTFQPGTGRMFVNDVGEGTWEEINDGGAGASGRSLNYGWPNTEGDFNQASFPLFTRPFYAYNHSSSQTTPSGNVITGGAFYSPAANTFGADFLNDYFFADLGSGWIYRIDLSTKEVTQFATNAVAVDLKVTDDGSLYYLAFGARKVFRVTRPGAAPVFSVQPQNQTVAENEIVTFTAVASGSPAYQWERRDSATAAWSIISGATSGTLAFTAQLSDSGDQFRVKATNAGGTTVSSVATLTVTGTSVLPSPWQQTDVGSVGAAGTAVFSNGVFEVTGAGFIRGRADSFHFVYQQAADDCTITARVSELALDGRRDENARAGVMVRGDLTDGSAHMFIGPKAKGPVQMVARERADRASDTLNAGRGSAPQWVRVTREGSVLTSFRSEDGVTWSKVRSKTIPLGASVYIGLAVCSDEAGLQSASFDNVTAAP